MGKAIKITFGVLGIILLGVVVLAIVAPLLIDPNDYKPEIAAAVEDATGRRLEIEGDIGLSVFPWLALELGPLQLSNAAGFGEAPFARLSGAEVRLKLLPLLSKRVEVGTIALHDLQLNLARKADGRSNWDDLAGEPAAESSAPDDEPGSGGGLEALTVGGIELSNARIEWDDRQADAHYLVQKFNLRTGSLEPGQPVKLDLDFELSSDAPQLVARVALAGEASIDPDAQQYTVEGLELSLDASGEALPMEQVKIRLAADVVADLAAQTLTVAGMKLVANDVTLNADLTAEQILDTPRFAGSFDLAAANLHELLADMGIEPPLASDPQAHLEAEVAADLAAQTLTVSGIKLAAWDVVLSADLTGEKIMDAPRFAGSFDLATFNLRDLLADMGMEAPVTSDPQALTRVAMQGQWQATATRADISQLALTLDDTHVNGKLGVSDFARSALVFDLQVDDIDADRYLPPPADKAGTGKSTKAAAAGAKGEQAVAEIIPVEMLRTLNAEGKLVIGTLKVAGLRMGDLRVSVNARDGLVQTEQTIGKLYRGKISSKTRIDVRGKTPQLSVTKQLSGVDIGPLLKDLVGEERLSGLTRANADLKTAGATEAALRRNLNGKLDFAFTDGAVHGFNIASMIRNAQAQLTGQSVPKESGDEKTDFSELSGSATITNGLLQNNDLKAKSPFLRLTGKGNTNLATEAVDYHLTPTIVGSLEGQGGAGLEELKGVPVPIHIKGSWSKPDYTVDVAAAVSEKTKAKIEKKIDKERKKIEEKIGDELRDKLKGLF